MPDNEGLPPGFVPVWTFIRTPEGVVEYEHNNAPKPACRCRNRTWSKPADEEHLPSCPAR